MELKILKIRNVKTPTYSKLRSTIIDFYVPNDFNEGNPYSLSVGSRVTIPLGLRIRIPEFFVLQTLEQTSIWKRGLLVKSEVWDETFTGELMLSFVNMSKDCISIHPGEKIARFILSSVVRPELNLYSTESDLFGDLISEDENEDSCSCGCF